VLEAYLELTATDVETSLNYEKMFKLKAVFGLEQMFFLVSSNEHLFGASVSVQSNGYKYSCARLSSNAFTNTNMNTYISLVPPVSQVFCTDEHLGVKTYFVSVYVKNKQKHPLFCSLMLARFPNISISHKLRSINHFDIRGLVHVQFRMNTDRMLNSSSTQFAKGKRLKGYVINLDLIAYNFITCDGSKTQLTFDWITNSFELHVWIGILITFGAWVLILHRMMKTCNILLPYALLLKQSFEIKTCWMKSPFFIRSLVPVLFGTIILTNCYKSLFTTDLTAPRVTKNVESLEKLSELNYTIHAALEQDSKHVYDYTKVNLFGTHLISINEYSVSDLKNVEKVHVECDPSKYVFLNFHMDPFKYFKLVKKLAYSGFCEKWVKTGLLLAPKMAMPIGYPHISFQDKIGECNKSAFI